MASVVAASPSPTPSALSNSESKTKSDSMDIDDDDEDNQSDVAVDDRMPPHNNRPSSSSSTLPSIDTAAPTNPSASLSSPSFNSDEPAASVVYIPGAVLPTLTKYVGRLLEVRIACRYLSVRSKEVLTRQLWGGADGHYTDDSDAVCLLIHSGLQVVRANPPADVSGNGGVVLTVRVGEVREQYGGVERNGLRSRSWVSRYHRLSLQVVGCAATDNINATRSKASPAATTATTPAAADSAAASAAPGAAAASSTVAAAKKDKKELRALKMLVVDKPSGAAGAAGGYARVKATKRKYIPECSLSFGDDESVWLHYSLWAVSDRAVDDSSWCSARIRSELLRLEGRDGRFEVRREARKGEKKGSVAAAAAAASSSAQLATSLPFTSILALKPATADFDTYSWTAVRKEAVAAAPAAVAGGGGRRNGAVASGVDVVSGLDWSELEWSPDGVRVRGREYKIDRVRWEKL